MEVQSKELKEAENTLRDLRNWLAVFKTEYDLAEEAYTVLNKKVEDVAGKLGKVKCTSAGVDTQSMKPASAALRDLKNWLAVFGKEYDVAEEALDVLTAQIDKVGQKMAAIKCV